MNTEHPKPLSFDQWYTIYNGILNNDKDTCKRIFDAARRGLAGPLELVWKRNNKKEIFSTTTLGNYHVWSGDDSAYYWDFDLKRDNFCLSIEDGKRQAQAHFESLWWSMSKPAEEQ